MARLSRQQPRLIGAGRPTRPNSNPKVALVVETVRQEQALRQYRKWLRKRAA